MEYCREGSAAWAKRSGHQVRVVAAPSGRRLDLFRELLEVGAPDIDVLQIKVIWPGLLAENLVDLRPYAGEVEEAHFPDIIRNSTVDGRLVALPWFANIGRLYYRQDLLEKYDQKVPGTSWLRRRAGFKPRNARPATSDCGDSRGRAGPTKD